MLEYSKNNPTAPLTISAPTLRQMIIDQLPKGAPHPSPSTVRNKLASLRDEVGAQVGDKKTHAVLKKKFLSPPDNRKFAVPIAAGMGLGLLGDHE